MFIVCYFIYFMNYSFLSLFFFFSSRRRHTRLQGDWSSDVCSSDLGPHVTECPDEALGRDGGPRHADAVALGEADETWPLLVADAARGELKEIYQPEIDAKGNDKKPTLQPYPHLPWETLDLEQFSLVP